VSRYRIGTNKPRSFKPKTPQAEAAIQLIVDVDTGRHPDPETLRAVRDALAEILSSADAGKTAKAVFGQDKGGRPSSSGFTRSDIVSAVIELERRKLKGRGALTRAKTIAGQQIEELAKPMTDESRKREIERDWKAGKRTVKDLSNADLESLLTPHRIPDKNP
jgi:hypothetical protein